jgi:Small nuclear RNA activating complex (SNAPc), subunit SNAP43.
MAYHLSCELECLKHDINTLFSNFHAKQSVRFEDFCEEWRSLNFSCIFGATIRNTVQAKMRIVERLFRVASEFLSEESTFLYRVAAVYTFYAVYFKQVTAVKVKIRMTPTMWEDLMQFVEILKEHQHFDVVYIIHTLKNQKAFCFTAFPKELFFGRHEFMLGIEGKSGFQPLKENSSYMNGVLNEDNFLNKVKGIHEDYSLTKEKLLNESKEEEKEDLSKVLFYSNDKFPEDLSKMISSHKRKYSSLNHSVDKEDEPTQRPVLTQLQDLEEQYNLVEDEDEDTPDSRRSTMAKLKEKVWSFDIKFEKGSRFSVANEKPSNKESSESENDYAYYKKSAMLQIRPLHLNSPGNPDKKQSKGLRFKTSNLKEDEQGN